MIKHPFITTAVASEMKELPERDCSIVQCKKFNGTQSNNSNTDVKYIWLLVFIVKYIQNMGETKRKYFATKFVLGHLFCIPISIVITTD